jgi:MFS family permease
MVEAGILLLVLRHGGKSWTRLYTNCGLESEGDAPLFFGSLALVEMLNDSTYLGSSRMTKNDIEGRIPMESSHAVSRLKWLMLFAAIVSFIQLQIANLSIAPLLEKVGQDLNVPFANNLMTAFLFSGNLVLLWLGGAICDRFGVLVSAFLGIACATVPMALMPWLGHDYTMVFWLRIVEGLSAGFAFPAQGQILAHWFPDNQRGLACGFMGAAVAIGSAAGLLAGPAVYGITHNWQSMSAWLSIFGWISLAYVLIVALATKGSQPVRHSESQAQSGVFKRSLMAPITWVAVLTSFMASWCMQCLFNLTPTILSSHKPVGAGYTPLVAGSLMQAVTITAILGPNIAGIFLDKVFHGKTKYCMLIGFVLQFIFIGSLLISGVIGNPPVLVMSLVLAGMGVQFAIPMIYIYASQAYSEQVVGRMTGLWFGLGTFGGVLGLYLGGATVASTGNYNMALTFMTIAGVVGFLLVFVLFKQKTLKAQ